MRFLLDAEQTAFARSLDALLTAAATPAVVRSWGAGDPAAGRALWSRIADAGVFALAVPEAYGGLGPRPVELALAFVELGRHVVPGPLVETVAAAALCAGPGPAERFLPGLASGETIATLSLPGGGPYVLDGDVADVEFTVTGTVGTPTGARSGAGLSERGPADGPEAGPAAGAGPRAGAGFAGAPGTEAGTARRPRTGSGPGPEREPGAGEGAASTSTDASAGGGGDGGAGASTGGNAGAGTGGNADASTGAGASTGPDAGVSTGGELWVAWASGVPRVRRSLDPARRLCSPRPRGELLDAGPRVVAGAADALHRARLAVAAQALGVGLALLDRTVAYVGRRHQFGVPVGSFQAVKHRLADARIALEFARPLLFGAALSMDPADIAAAKVTACEAAYATARTALQLHGAIGYTAEYDLSLWLTRARALRTAWGSPGECRALVLGDRPDLLSGGAGRRP